MRVPGGDESGPNRERPPALDEPVEARFECLYNRVPKPYNPYSEVTENPINHEDRLHRFCDSPNVHTYRPGHDPKVPVGDTCEGIGPDR